MARHRHEQPRSLGAIIGGVVLCLGAIGGLLVLVSTGVLTFHRDPDVSSSQEKGDPALTPSTPQSGARPAAPLQQPSEVVIGFAGRFTEKGDMRKVTYACPYCQKSLTDVGVAMCPSCAKPVKWPAKVTCGFCGGSKCGTCRGDGKCPVCGKAPRMLMGVRPPCETCKTTGKCPACGEAKKCTFCEGGTYYPGKEKQDRVIEPAE